MAKKEKVFLPGASGSMGHEAFKRLWKLKDEYDIVLLQRPSKKNKDLFEPYEKEVGITPIPKRGIVESEDKSFKIVWGDVTNYQDVKETIGGVNWVLSCMALISPTADYCQEEAHQVNT